MGKYTGSQCIICGNFFQDEDEIVVCPDCGTPYHRACYQTEGRCINTALHAVGGSWQSVQNEQRRSQGGIECSHCGYVNFAGTQTCASCGLPLFRPDEEAESSAVSEENTASMGMQEGQQYYFQSSDPCCGMSPDYEIEGEKLGDVANFVQTNTLYYIPLFRRFKETDRKISFNLPCVLFPYFYFANRKMWFMTILSGLIWLLCSLPDMFLNMLASLQDSANIQSMLSLGMEMQTIERMTEFLTARQQMFEQLQTPLFFVLMAFRVILCLFGNYLYFRFVLKSVRKIRENSPTLTVRKALLSAEGGTNFWNVLGCCGLYFGAIFLLSMILTAVSL